MWLQESEEKEREIKEEAQLHPFFRPLTIFLAFYSHSHLAVSRSRREKQKKDDHTLKIMERDLSLRSCL